MSKSVIARRSAPTLTAAICAKRKTAVPDLRLSWCLWPPPSHSPHRTRRSRPSMSFCLKGRALSADEVKQLYLQGSFLKQNVSPALAPALHGKLGQGLNFDGVNDYVRLTDPANGSLDFGDSQDFYSLHLGKDDARNGAQDVSDDCEQGSLQSLQLQHMSADGTLAPCSGAATRVYYLCVPIMRTKTACWRTVPARLPRRLRILVASP
jgi:hypothetical protein